MMATDERFDESISAWMEQTAPARLPERVLDATFERTRLSRQQVGWRAGLARIRFPGRSPMSSSVIVLGGAAVLVMAAAVAVSLSDDRASIGGPTTPAPPTSPRDWSRVVIDADAEGGVDVVAAGPRGILAGVGEGEESRLYFSADGRDWTRVPADQHGPVGTNGAALVATDEGFLLVGNEVLASEDGLSWRRIAGPADDPDLRAGTLIAAAAGGPGLVAVGSDNKAWYSTDGTDWTLADVPPPPDEPSVLERPLDRTQTQGAVEMEGIAVSGHTLLAWGKSIWVHDDGSGTFVPVFWTSTDGLSWRNQSPPDPLWDYPNVTGGPNGFIMAGEHGPIWLSADGTSWERVAEDAFGPSRWPALQNDDGNRVQMLTGSIAAGPTGYVAVGTDGVCLLRCSSAEAVIWTSPDGRTWSRLPDGDVFRAPSGAGAGVAAAWESRFIVGGESDNRPTIWISGASPASTAPPTSSPVELPADGKVVEPESSSSVVVDGYRYTFRVPGTGWTTDVVTAAQAEADHPDRADFELTQGDASHDPADLAGFELWGNATQVHRVRCQELMGASNDVGPTADDLASAIASLDGFTSSGPTDVTVGGYTGKRLQLAVPADRWAACVDGAYRYAYGSFTDEDFKDREYQGPEQIDDIWILDLENGHRQLFLITYFPTTPTDWVDELRQMIESLEIGPVEGAPAAGRPVEPPPAGPSDVVPVDFTGSSRSPTTSVTTAARLGRAAALRSL